MKKTIIKLYWLHILLWNKVAIALCLIGIAINIYSNFTILLFMYTNEKTIGTITDIQKVIKNSTVSTEASVEFYVDGKKHKGKIDFNKPNLSIGDEIMVYYDINNPENFIANALIGSIVVFIVFSIVMCIFVFTHNYLKEKMKERVCSWK